MLDYRRTYTTATLLSKFVI